MSAPILNSLPARTEYSYSKDKYESVPHQGVWSLQLSLAQISSDLGDEFPDGYFGVRTKEAVRNYQRNRDLYTDGIAGPATQKRIIQGWTKQAEKEVAVPVGFIDGFSESEGGFYLAAVNWAVAGGVDVADLQNRVYNLSNITVEAWNNELFRDSHGNVIGPKPDLLEAVSFDSERVGWSLDNKNRILDFAKSKRRRKNYFYDLLPESSQGHPSYHNNKLSWQYAALYHNWPYGADRLAKGYILSDQKATWIPPLLVNQGIDTYADWADYYIEKVCKYVQQYIP